MNKHIGDMKGDRDYYRTIEDLKENGYRLHHTGSRRGYVSRKSGGNIEAYKGRFGEGFALVLPRFDTTRYVNIQYWIKEA